MLCITCCHTAPLQVGLDKLSPMAQLYLRVQPPSGPAFDVPVKHTLSEDQIGWIRAGSALNQIAQLQRAQA